MNCCSACDTSYKNLPGEGDGLGPAGGMETTGVDVTSTATEEVEEVR